MNTNQLRPTTLPRPLLLLATVVLVTALMTSAIVVGYFRSQRQAAVAARGAQVMPFDLDQTTHVFEQQTDGGLQTVTAQDPTNTEQIRLVREHLQAEAIKFSQGNFSDPATIHGQTMPGLQELQAGAQRIIVRYDPLPAGGQLRYTTQDPSLVQALHSWFAAQRSDHGQHAMP